MSKKRGNILIVRSHYRKAYPIIHSLKKANFTVVCGIDNNTKLFKTEGFSRHMDKFTYINNPNISEDSYIKSIIRVVKNQHIDLIVPVGFIDFQLISKHKREIKKHCIVPVEDYEIFSRVADKWQLQNICRKLNVKYPRSLLIERDMEEGQIRAFVDEVGLPAVVKGIGDGSLPVFYSDLDDILKKVLHKKNQGLLLQEFVNGAGVGYFVFSDKGDILTEFMHKRIFEASPLGGASIKACSNYDRDLLDLGRKFVKNISWTGVMMLECKKESETGELYLIEANPKFWGSLELSYKAGVDFPRYMAEYYLEGKKPNKTFYRNICFSWFATTSFSYGKYGLPTLFEAVIRTVQRDLLLTDLHILDPINFMQKVAIIVGLTILRHDKKRTLPKIHQSKRFGRTYFKDINCIISDFDGTITKLPVDWHGATREAQNIGLVRKWERINQAYYRLWLNNKKEFMELSELIKKHEMVAAKKIKNNVELTKKIEEIKENNIKFIIVSKQSEESLILGLRKIGILNYVDEIIGRESEVLRRDQIMIGINRTFNSKNDISKLIMVGDQLSDIKASLQSGICPWMIAQSNIKKIQALELDVSYADNINIFFDALIKHSHTNI